MFGINPVLDAVWAGIWFGAILCVVVYMTGVNEDDGPRRYQRWRAAWVMWRQERAARRRAGMISGTISVSRYGMDADGMPPPAPPAPSPEPPAPDIDALNPGIPQFDRDMTESEWIVYMAVARGKDKKYRFSANAIHTAIGGDRNAVLATIKELRSVAPPAEYMQPDGTRAAATHPVTGAR